LVPSPRASDLPLGVGHTFAASVSVTSVGLRAWLDSASSAVAVGHADAASLRLLTPAAVLSRIAAICASVFGP
jgi:hypothetical protein